METFVVKLKYVFVIEETTKEKKKCLFIFAFEPAAQKPNVEFFGDRFKVGRPSGAAAVLSSSPYSPRVKAGF